MKKELTQLLTVPTLIAVILTSTAFGFQPTFTLPANNIGKIELKGNAAANDLTDKVALRDVARTTFGVDGGSPVRNETASDLNTTTFDTLVGTVSVNLPDDAAAGDTISGTVISEPKGKTGDEQAKNQDELKGYVVEVAEQRTSSQTEGGDRIDFCKDPNQKPDDHSISICNKWSIPENVSKIAVVLKNQEGKIVGQTEVPVAKHVNGPNIDSSEKGGSSVDQKMKPASAADYLLPPVGQAGKPIAVNGSFDGNFTSAKVKIGDQTMAKFLASSPRKFVVESPRGLTGLSNIEIEYKGMVVARCPYRSISVRLAAEKLNLTKGEQTTLTITLAGLVGLLSPVSIQLSNKSPGTVSMANGETQTIYVGPEGVNGDIWKTTRSLTGVKAGGFSITASVNPAVPSHCSGTLIPGTEGNLPGKPIFEPNQNGQPILTPRPTPRPTPENVDADGNPRTNDGPGHQVSPLRGRFRVTLNGFSVNHVTYHGLLQRPDVITFYPDVSTYDVSGRRAVILQGGATNTIGMFPESPVQGGTSSSSGGFQNGDGFPTQNQPWRRSVTYSSGGPGTIPPTVYFENELIQNTNAAVIIPDIWSIMGENGENLRTAYLDDLIRARSAVGRAVTGIITHPPRRELGSYLRNGSTLGIENTISLGFGYPQDRPIGMHSIGNNRFGFTPQVLVLTYDSAEYISRTSFGFGIGVVPIRYVDDSNLAGDYTLYLQVERVDTMPPPAPSIIGVHFTGTAVLTTSRDEAPGPYNADVNLTVDFTDGRRIIHITNFPPLLSNSDTPLGPNTSTMTLVSGGSGSFVSFRIQMPVTLGLQNSNAFFGNSTLPLTLTGVLDPATGSVTLTGTGTFSGGQLGTFLGTVVVRGTFSPSP